MEDYKIAKDSDSKFNNIKDVSRKYDLVNEIVDTAWYFSIAVSGTWLGNVVYGNTVHRYD